MINKFFQFITSATTGPMRLCLRKIEHKMICLETSTNEGSDRFVEIATAG